MECFICRNKIKPHNVKHLYYCAKLAKLDYPKEELKFSNICFNADFQFTKEYLVEKYCKQYWSLPDFKNSHGLSYGNTQFLLDYFHIHRRTIKEASVTEKKKDQYRSTCQSKYGVNNVSQLDEVKKKKVASFRKHYDVDNIFQDIQFKGNLNKMMLAKYGKKRITNPELISKTRRERYTVEELKMFSKIATLGYKKWYESLTKEEIKSRYNNLSQKLIVFWENAPPSLRKKISNFMSKVKKDWWDSLSDDRRNDIVAKLRIHIAGILSQRRSNLERKVGEVFDKWGITYTSQHTISRYIYDFLIGKNILIEVNGDYWHCNPKQYQGTDIVRFPGGERIVKDIWEKDKRKKAKALSMGYKFIVIWECDIKKHKHKLEEYIKGMLKEVKDDY